MWLIITGEQCHQISPTITYQIFRQRFDVEHLHRFGKQRLLMTLPILDFRFWILDWRGKVSRGEDGEQITHNRKSKIQNPKLIRPWERYLEAPNETQIMSPSAVQRDFQRIISKIEKPGNSPKSRGIPTGRVTGQRLPKRSPQPVVKSKSKSKPEQPKAA